MRIFRPFNRLENSLERAIEGSLDRVFKPSVQPSEIARKLAREMAEKQMVSVRGAIVPNHFTVSLNPVDLAAFEGGEEPIARHIKEWLDDEADRLGFITMSEIVIEFAASDAVRPRSIGVTSAITEPAKPQQSPAGRIDRTEAFWVQPPQAPRTQFVVEVVAGPLTGFAHFLQKAETSVGRALDNDWVIDAADVSRHHAVLQVHEDQGRVVDLSSLNGTFVNGRRVTSWSPGFSGDVITFGLVETRLRHDRR